MQKIYMYVFHAIRWNREDSQNLQWCAAAACQSLWNLNFFPAVGEEPGQMVLLLTSDLEFCHTDVIIISYINLLWEQFLTSNSQTELTPVRLCEHVCTFPSGQWKYL